MKFKKGKVEFLNIIKQQKLLIIFILAAVIMIVYMNQTMETILLENTQMLGDSIAYNYFHDDENRRISYQNVIEQGKRELDNFENEEMTYEEAEKSLYSFFDYASEKLGEDMVDSYAVINDRIIADNPWEGDDDYNFKETEWYKRASESPGKVIFTDLYKDAITGKMIITIAQKSETSGNVMVFDVFPENFENSIDLEKFPEGTSAYLVDSNGRILYAKSGIKNINYDEMNSYVSSLVSGIKEGKLKRSDSYFYDYNGEKRTAYYYISDAGWVSIITMPMESIFKEINSVFDMVMSTIFILIIICIRMIIKNTITEINARKINETVNILGNSYYAIYRLNYNNGKVSMIKPSKDIVEKLGGYYHYEKFIECFKEIVNKKDYKNFKEAFSLENLKKLVEDGVKEFGGDFRRKFGNEYKWVNVRVLFDEAIESEEIILCFREVEREKKVQKEQLEILENALENAKKSEQSKIEFFSGMSHDMRTPLNAIIGLSELSMKDNEIDSVKMKDYLKKINKSSKQLLMLINDVLEVSSIERGKLTIENKEINIEKLFADICDPFIVTAESQGKKFNINIDVINKKVITDDLRISQLMNNLISNAIKFSDEGDEIYVGLEEIAYQERAKYKITIKDTGRGMAEDFIEKLFEPYARERQFGAKYVEGTGLGMYIVKSIVNEMQGQINVKSKLGEGTSFDIIIPMEIVEELGTEESNSKSMEKNLDFSNKKILVAEDNELNMEITCEILKMHGIEVLKAYNGKEAVDIFKNSELYEINAILMDMQMPEMDGCEASKEIRKMDREDSKEVPIIAVTANAFVEDISKTTAAGMNRHISKPIEFNILKETLNKYL